MTDDVKLNVKIIRGIDEKTFTPFVSVSFTAAIELLTDIKTLHGELEVKETIIAAIREALESEQI